MDHKEKEEHDCPACRICRMNLPNVTIRVIQRMEGDPEAGKEKKRLDQHLGGHGRCIFCALCTQTCPQDAIEFTNAFEHSVFTSGKLLKQLNHPGSRLMVKPKEKTE